MNVSMCVGVSLNKSVFISMDVHDIGKNLVDIILTNNGYETINLGIKISINEMIEAAGEERAPDQGEEMGLIESLKAKMGKTPQTRLQQLVEYDSQQAAHLLKQWLLAAERA